MIRSQSRRSGLSLTSALFVLGLLVLAGCEPRGEESIVRERPASDRGQTVAEILAIPDRLDRVERLSAYLQSAPQTETAVAEILDGYQLSYMDRGDIELVLLLEWWARFDPEGAFDWTRQDWRAEHPRLSYALLRAVARDDPQKGVDLLLESRGGRFTEYAVTLQPVIVGWSESGEPGVLKFILSQPDTNLRQKALGTYARLMTFKLGPEQAIAWADELSEGRSETFARHLRQRVAASIAEMEPEMAANWVGQLVRQGASETLLRRIAGRWGRRDPVAALTWLEEFEPTSHQQQAVSQTYAGWYGRSPDEAESWLLAQGDAIGTHLAPAVMQIMKSREGKLKRDPDFELDWEENLNLALQIQNEPQRWGAVLFICRGWMRRDPESANAWMQENGVPETYQLKARAVLEQPKQPV